MEQNLRKVFDYYQDFYKNPNMAIPFDMKKLFRRDMPNDLGKILNLDNQKYLIYGSTGTGNLTELPWLGIFDRKITESAQVGFYVVFLFQKDMQGFYLSLNQGTKNFREKFKNHKPIRKMSEVANKIKGEIEFDPITDLVGKVNLNSNIQNARAYEAANIQAKYYSKDLLPTNDELVDDINKMLSNLEKIKQFIGIRDLDEVIDDLIHQEEINDVKFQKDILISKPADTPRNPQPLPSKKGSKSEKEKFIRDPKVAKEALENAKFLCEVDPSHLTFISPLTNHNFVEAHHLIPMANQEKYIYSIDVPGNIVSLCPNCHREIHHGTLHNKRLLVSSLYQTRKEMLRVFGIDGALENILAMY